MGKRSTQRRLAENEAMAVARRLRTGSRKLNLVGQLIRGLPVEKALTQLSFSPRRISREVKRVLESAIANAENNHNLDVDRLVVAEAYVGKSIVMKRFRPRARGRMGRISKPFSRITVVVREQEES
ncbi:MAG: 50S ribosomal protein L22 [Alphaproteobacteria bacterium MarineAlpha9_Bin5]|nr:MAG: 50S ribosomal protein L22 [Alphaproteobacteria bacterium MarineAlpha9_Bin5]PPR33351.1 MAG: 50S ribosomal protein L22 [Alphaproteobacteria bacterium MarineAlpha9_Bin6]HIB56810.1 50S ribosomal protein L22 [Alphaproteobacteria bacterium]